MILPMVRYMLDCCWGLQYIAGFVLLLTVFYSYVQAYLPTAGLSHCGEFLPMQGLLLDLSYDLATNICWVSDTA